MGYSEGMKDFWKWLTSARDDKEMARLEREGADIDVVYALRPSYIYSLGVLYALLMGLLDILIGKELVWKDNLEVHGTVLVAFLGAAIFSHFMEKHWSWRRTGVTGILVAIAVGALFYYLQGLIF